MALAMMGGEGPRSPEAKLGLRVKDLWDVQEPQLSPTEKLNACFENIPVSAFPLAPLNRGSDINISILINIKSLQRVIEPKKM